jgi:hypothetical protein
VSADRSYRNLDERANVTFTIAANSGDQETIDITLPYRAFDFVATYPLAGITNDSSRRYFPLKRGDEGQYYLGRTFLQSA